jgi:chemotaxis protein MotB
MARRKRHQEEHVNHERWLVSYADFITLLFAFFVVMYAISSVNQGKYRVLSDTLDAAFNPKGPFEQQQRTLDPIQVGEVSSQAGTDKIHVEDAATAIVNERMDAIREQASDRALVEQYRETIDTMANELDDALQTQIESDLVNIKRNDLWLEIDIKSSLLFRSGFANVSRDAMPVLQEIARILSPFPNRIHVEGFTDNVPISNPVYPSNWELSAARAASVVRLLSEQGMDAEKMAAIGYGEFRPIADNNTVEGRSQNRRVSLVVLAAGNFEAASPGAEREALYNDAELQGNTTPELEQGIQQLPLNEGL